METRAHKGTVEVREGPNGPMIAGYAAVFNRDSEDMGFIEQVDPGAFTKTLAEADIRALGNHDANWLLGRAKAGTLRLRADGTGLYYEVDVNTADPDGQRALAKVQRGDWDGSSFGFVAVRDTWDWQAAPPKRRLLEARLLDVGPVTYPAYPDSTAASRALDRFATATGRPVEELVAALRTGEIRSIIQGANMADEKRGLPTDAGAVAWGPEDGFRDLLDDVNDQLGVMFDSPNGLQAFYAIDASITLDKVLLSDWDCDEFWVAPITMNGVEPAIAPQEQWVPVEQGWVVTEPDDEILMRALAINAVERRAGKVLSAKNLDVIKGVVEQLRDLMKTALSEEPPDSEVTDVEEEQNFLTVTGTQLELRQRELAVLETTV